MCEEVGLEVVELKRTHFMGISLENLRAPGYVVTLSKAELKKVYSVIKG